MPPQATTYTCTVVSTTHTGQERFKAIKQASLVCEYNVIGVLTPCDATILIHCGVLVHTLIDPFGGQEVYSSY